MNTLVNVLLVSGTVALSTTLAPVTPRSVSDPGVEIRVVTMNVAGTARGGALVEALESHEDLRNADVLMLQEIESTPASHAPREVAESLGFDLAFAVGRRSAIGVHGIATMSRHPLRNVEVLALPRFDLGYRSRHRVALFTRIDVAGESIGLLNVHLDTRLRMTDRILQIAPVVERATALDRAVVGGDFNTIRAFPWLLPWVPVPFPGFGQTRAFDAFMLERGLERSLPNVGATGPLGMELDALYHSGLEATDHGTVPLPEISDHLALWVDLRVPAGKAGSG